MDMEVELSFTKMNHIKSLPILPCPSGTQIKVTFNIGEKRGNPKECGCCLTQLMPVAS